MTDAPPYDPVPAIAEIDASGDTAALFADIRATLGIPVVNLIWRHLATIPGALPWAWTSLKPLYQNNAIACEAESLNADLNLPRNIAEYTALSVPTLAAAGLSGPDLERITMILRSYERSNAMNIIAVETLRSWLEDDDKVHNARVATPSVSSRQSPISGAMPKVLSPDEMSCDTRALVDALNSFGGRRDILPTMYRHLAHWPAYLALVHVLLAPHHASGQLEALIVSILSDSRARSARLGAALPTPASDLDAAVRDDVLAALTVFAEGPLCKMIAIVTVISAAMPQGPHVDAN